MLSIDLTTLLSILLLIYAWWPGSAGRSRWTGRLVALCLLSPGLRYLSALFSFPIRLKLSAWAGVLLRLAGMNVQVEGNVLIKTTQETGPIDMAVDPACMGLQLTGVSLLLGLFALIWQERVQQRKVALGWIVAYESFVFGLTIFCNLLRIVLLVAFSAMPGTWIHEGIGLVCVMVYTWLPTWWLARLLVQRVSQIEPESLPTDSSMSMLKSAGWGLGLLVIGLSIRAFASLPSHKPVELFTSAKSAPAIGSAYASGCQRKILANGFIQFSKPGLLLYLKPQPDWFSADHSPMACWQGSGYELLRVRETTVDGHLAYVGELRKKGRVLYTAWWFSNGAITTISQLTMRGKMLWGAKDFVLVNVTMDKPFRDLTADPE
ncbi:exosortase N [Spirosoma sp. HMF4905]|uniref:Exosortase N n=1 Tax=Spirosoma arboris TaxID=2682092 RepID=A0A7K1S4X1_9BACT|nr:exosortase N [Spirosoma arboris]MVM28780.1 exosortase N [Spirosoma arboris]